MTRQELTPTTRTLGLDALEYLRRAEKAQSIGAACYLRKPLNVDKLLDVVSDLCNPQLDERRPRAEGDHE